MIKIKDTWLKYIISTNAVIQCNTKTEYEEFMQLLQDNDIRWQSGIQATNGRYWTQSRLTICIALEMGNDRIFMLYASPQYYTELNREIILYQQIKKILYPKQIRFID